MPVTAIAPVNAFDLDDDDDEGWEEMPVIREDKFASGLDEEDQKKYHYTPSAKATSSTNATGNLIDFDEGGNEWRSKLEQNESEYTRLRVNEEDETDEVHMRTKYLFDEDKAMTPLSQMQATKNLLTEAQRIAYVGLCALITQEMAQSLKRPNRKEFKSAVQNMDLWAMKIMGRLYYHMELETQEQKMIESLAQHGVQAADLVPALMTTHTVANPEYDPAEARRQAEVICEAPETPPTPTTATQNSFQTTSKVLEETSTAAIPGVSTTLSAADKNVTLDIRWTVLCDLFLLLIADSVYDARSRVLLEQAALKLGLGWLDVVRFESRVTEALEIQEDVEKMEQQEVIDGRQKAARKKRYMMLGLATLGGGLVIGLSAGLLAPVIGVGLGAAFSTIGITGTTGFLAGAGGAAVITTGGVLTGSSIAVRGMINRTQQVRTFEVLPLHNNKRVNCILTVPGFMTGKLDDVRLPFSVLDPVVGDVFSVLWEPEMIQETGSALKILTGEVLTQSDKRALQWPISAQPMENALDRAKAAGSVLADVLMQRHLGLAKHKAYGIVQDVFILGTTVSVPTRMWCETRSVVSGRYVNAFARNDWVLNYLFRATSGGVGTVAGLRPVENVPGLENVDLGFPVFADYFDDPVQRPTCAQSVSRPPSVNAFSKHSRASSVSLDEDLPPRVGTPAPASGAGGSAAPGPASPAKDAPDNNSKIPIHAGFDFNAIKDVLGEAERNPDELKIRADNQFPAPPIPSPTNRSESAPPQQQTPPALGPPFDPPSSPQAPRGRISRGGELDHARLPRSHNPFAASYLPADTGLSFGGADGSIKGAFSAPSDPWSIPGDLGKKKSPAFNSNPWG
ncbi:hypothetical protein B0H10DRAFT_2074448 [Mycena sp. CBHHK59/15]|nr:hypothetical protein B0H10DRAFT_2074448 [Mycena sp. CBHHK59/15]